MLKQSESYHVIKGGIQLLPSTYSSMKNILLYTVLMLLLPLHLAGQRKSKSAEPLNVIILIGDGMGAAQLSVPYYYGEGDPVFTKFKNIGMVLTSSARHKVTDSAAGASAMFTGSKTYNNAIGVDNDTIYRKNLVEILSDDRDYMTGLVTTSSVTDATPAGFYAHVSERTMHYDIAKELLSSEIDFFAGGGLQYFISTDGTDYFKKNNIEMYNSELSRIKKPEAGKRYGFLMAMDGLPAMLDGRGDYLPKASGIALDYLSKSEQGFILMIEGAQIDWAGHSNNTDYLLTEMLDFEEAVQVAYNFAKKDKNTLLIVTADHETGGFTLGASGESLYGEDYATIVPSFATRSHSATLVPLLAYGPGSDSFRGILANTDIFSRILDAIKKH